MSGSHRRVLLVLVVAAAFGACGKRAAEPPALVTELVGTTEVERDGVVTAAHAGSHLAFGDLVRTGEGAWARIRFAGGQTLRVGERTQLRLGRDARLSAQITVALGEAEIDGGGEVSVATPRGPARLEAGGRLRVRADERRTRFEVMVGRARFGEAEREGAPEDGGAGGNAFALASGEGLAIAIGGAVIERYRVRVGTAELEPAGVPARKGVAEKVEEEPSAEEEPGAPDAGANTDAGPAEDARGAQAPAGTPNTAEPAATRLTAAAEPMGARSFDIGVTAGESAVVHAERPPVLIRLQLPPGCVSSSARLRFHPRGPRPAVADGPMHLLVELPRGAFRYRLSCAPYDRQDVARGALTVRRDSGAATLPRTAPRNRLDADGRRYTVLFQNHLPAFALSWPRLTGRPPYTLVIESRGQTRKLTAKRPTYQLKPGALPEGNHTWYWTSAEGKRSPTTTLALRFDNAAVAAEIQLPRPGALAPTGDPARIDVKGLTLPGSRVSVNEGPLPVDAQGRFRAELTLGSPPPRTLAIRVDHPRTGTHHYLRRLRRR